MRQPVRYRASIAAAYRRATQSSRDVIFRQDGSLFWPQPGEFPLPSEVWVTAGELQFFSPADIARLLDERKDQ